MNITNTFRYGRNGLITAIFCLGFSSVAMSNGSPGSSSGLVYGSSIESIEDEVAEAAAVIIRGKVTDDTGESLPGVNIVLKGTTNGAVTDLDGNFSLSIPDEGGTLIFSFMGFLTQEIDVDGSQTELSVVLMPDVKSLDEVVVVGYGTQKRANITGAVSSVEVDEQLSSRAVANVSSALSGLVPGLAATQSTGMAGNNRSNLLIRGLGTVNGDSGPLIVVDGMPDVDINRIDINDIESISVLKDAASAAIYGSRAANGVILVTTKSGKKRQDATITFTSTNAIETPTKGHNWMVDYPRNLTVAQRASSVRTLPELQRFQNGTVDEWMAMGMIDPLRFPNTDWWDVITRTGLMQRYNLSASGGNELSNFYISVGLMDQRGLQINNDYKLYNARINYDYQVRDNIKVGVKLTGNSSRYIYSYGDGFTDAGTGSFDMRFAVPGITPYDPETGYYGGVMAYGADPQAFNPYTVFMNNINNQNRQEANGSMYLDWKPVKGLTANVSYAVNYYNQFRSLAPMPNRAYNFQTNTFGSRIYVGSDAGVDNFVNTGHKTLFTGRLNYEANIGDDHTFQVLGVYTEEYWYGRVLRAGRTKRIHPSLSEIDGALPENPTATGSSYAEGLRSVIGRVNYSAFDKYLLEVNFRYDGSSKFLPGSRYGFFPSASIGWRFLEEDFINSALGNVFSDAKLRMSYGSLGNNAGVGRYEQKEVLDQQNYMVGGEVVRGFVYSKMVNPNLTWEAANVFNIGLDLGFLKNRLTAELDYYDRLTKGMHRPSNMSILLTGAYDAPRQNIANLRNRGVEANVTWRDEVGDFNYNINLNASYNRNRLETWNEHLDRGQIFLDMPYNFIYSYEDLGIAQTWQDVYDATPQGAAPGDLLRKDLNGDGLIDGNDRRAYPHIQRDRPTTNFALNSSFSWRAFDLVVFLQGSAGRKDYWINYFNELNFQAGRHNATWDYWDKPWSVDNRNGGWPRMFGNNNNSTTTFWLDNMSYLRVKNLQLGYNLPKTLLSKVGISQLRVYGAAENLFTFTSFRGLDPEKQGNANDLYPILKSFSLGVNLTL